MPRRVSIICKCGLLVDIVDNRIASHKKDEVSCDRSGERYVPSPRHAAFGGEGLVSPAGNPMEYLGSVEVPCPRCEEHPIGGLSFFAEKLPDSQKSYPEWTGPVGGVN